MITIYINKENKYFSKFKNYPNLKNTSSDKISYSHLDVTNTTIKEKVIKEFFINNKKINKENIRDLIYNNKT